MTVRIANRLLIVLAALVLVAVGVAITALVRGEATRNIVTDSPCQRDPGGRECQQTKIDSDKARSVRSACVITRKAGLGCPALEGGRKSARNRGPRDRAGRARAASPPTVGDAAAAEPSQTGPTTTTPDGGNAPPAAPPGPDAGGDPSDDGPIDTTPAGSDPPPADEPDRSGVDQILDGVGEAVEDVGETVQDVRDVVDDTRCQLIRC